MIRSLCLAMAVCAASITGAPAIARDAAASQAVRSYAIPAGPLDAALTAFSEKTGLRFAIDGGLAAGKTSPGLRGDFTLRQGLQRLLAGSGLIYRFTDANTVTLERAAAAMHSDAARLMTITVVGSKIGRTRADTPPSLTVIDGRLAQRPLNRSAYSVIQHTANVFVEDGAQLPAIRGIDGTAGLRQAFTAGTQPRAPILIDDVARPLFNSAAISHSSTWDVETIEVARGPQPTSTGRNALAGAIRVYTRDPAFFYEAAARLKAYSADGTVKGAGMINLPLVEDQLALRATVEESRGESFVDVNDPRDFPFDPEHQEFSRYRAKLRFRPEAVAGLDLQTSIDHLHTEGPLPGYMDGDPEDASISDFANKSAYEDNDQTTYISRANYALNEFAALELRGSFLDNELLFPDAGIGAGNVAVTNDQAEGEVFVRLKNLGTLRRGLIGVIHNQATEETRTDSSTFDFTTDGEIRNSGLYAEAEISLGALGLIEGLTLIAGGRYEIDDRNRAVSIAGDTVSDRSLDESRFLPMVGLRYAPVRDWTLGYIYSESFRAGGTDVDILGTFFSGADTVSFSEFDPEMLYNHEIYAKSLLWNGRVQTGVSVFYYSYEDAQLPGASTEPSGLGGTLFGNVPRARGYGLELETEIFLGDAFVVSGALGLLDTEITDAGPSLAESEGEELPRAPNVTANLGLSYGVGYGFFAYTDLRYVGTTRSGLNQPSIDDYAVLDLAAGYDLAYMPGGRSLRFTAYIENVFDETYFVFREDGSIGATGAIGRTRTYGVALGLRFD